MDISPEALTGIITASGAVVAGATIGIAKLFRGKSERSKPVLIRGILEEVPAVILERLERHDQQIATLETHREQAEIRQTERYEKLMEKIGELKQDVGVLVYRANQDQPENQSPTSRRKP